MPITLDPLPLGPAGHSDRPLAGLTVLVVEDSRFASEAVRLLCLRSGARIRRADSLSAARRHLGVYMPSVVIIDQGLPDGSGIELIRDLANAKARVPVILATSGDDRNLIGAMDAGADGFLPKPIESLAVFQKAVLENLPNYQHPKGPRLVSNEMIEPDQIAFRDDLAHVADLLTTSDHGETIDYVAKFLTGVARSAHDHALEAAATDLAKSHMIGAAIGSDLARVAGLLQERLEGQVVI